MRFGRALAFQRGAVQVDRFIVLLDADTKCPSLAPFFGAKRIQKGEFNVSTSFGVLFLALLCSFGNAFQRGLVLDYLEKKSLTLGRQVAYEREFSDCFRLFHHAQICAGMDGIKRL